MLVDEEDHDDLLRSTKCWKSNAVLADEKEDHDNLLFDQDD